MKTTTPKFTSMCKRLWLALAAISLISFAFNGTAQANPSIIYQGTLSFKGKIVNQCPELYRGDTARFSISLPIGDGIPRPRSKVTLWSGEITTVTSSGVSIVALGTLVGDASQATLYITDLIVGESCYFSGLNLSVKMTGRLAPSAASN